MMARAILREERGGGENSERELVSSTMMSFHSLESYSPRVYSYLCLADVRLSFMKYMKAGS